MFCVLFHGCKNKPKEQLENKMYLIPEISNDSILVFGFNQVSHPESLNIKTVFEIDKNEIIKTEKLIKSDFLIFCKLKNMYLYNELKDIDFKKLRRQYLFFEEKNGNKRMILKFWNSNFNGASKEYFKNCYLKPYTNRICSNGRLYVYSITIDIDNMEIIDYWSW
jgi:hypothetical protein